MLMGVNQDMWRPELFLGLCSNAADEIKDTTDATRPEVIHHCHALCIPFVPWFRAWSSVNHEAISLAPLRPPRHFYKTGRCDWRLQASLAAALALACSYVSTAARSCLFSPLSLAVLGTKGNTWKIRRVLTRGGASCMYVCARPDRLPQPISGWTATHT